MTYAEFEKCFKAQYNQGDCSKTAKGILITFDITKESKAYTYKGSYADILQKLNINNYIYEWDYKQFSKELQRLETIKANNYIEEDDGSGFGFGDIQHISENIEIEIEALQNRIKNKIVVH